jgi:3D (Asp-Asp-Asp) domain-containing protein
VKRLAVGAVALCGLLMMMFVGAMGGGVGAMGSVENASCTVPVDSETSEGNFLATAYGPPWNAMQGTGVTADGTDLRGLPHVLGVAVDPTVIPMGTMLDIQPNPFNTDKPFKAFDTGGAIKGKHIDFFDWRGREYQLKWNQLVKVKVVASEGKLQTLDRGAGNAEVESCSEQTINASLKDATGGAKGIVDALFEIAKEAGGAGVYVGSDIREGSTTSSGNMSDHSSNDENMAARDIGVVGIDLIVGPPHPKLDRACEAIVEELGGNYKPGTRIVENFYIDNYRVQVIWHTPEYGGHMGHIHVGAKRTIGVP